MSDPATTETERWFLKRGLPHFIADYSPTRDVLTRAVPLFALIYLVEVANAPSRDFPIWEDVLAVAAGFGDPAGRVDRGKRGPQAAAARVALQGRGVRGRGVRPRAAGDPAPVRRPVALVTAVGNLLLLAVIFLGTSYGVVPITRWAGARTARELEQVMSLLVRALPLLTDES